MSSENQQNPSQENEKIKEKLINIINICLLAVVVFIIVFSIAYFVAPPKNISQYKELLIVIIPITLLFLFTTCLARRLKITFFENIKKKMSISSNSIFNLIILSCFISACSLNALINTSNDIIKDIETNNIKNEIKNEIQKSKCEIETQINEIKININNKIETVQTQTKNDNTVIQTVKENQIQNKDINGVTNSSPKESETNNTTNTPEKDNGTNNGNKCDIEPNQQVTSEDIKFLANILDTLGIAFLYFLSGYLFVVKDKVEDYLDTIDEQNS